MKKLTKYEGKVSTVNITAALSTHGSDARNVLDQIFFDDRNECTIQNENPHRGDYRCRCINVVVIIESGVDGFFGGVHVGVLNSGAVVIFSRKLSSCLSERALCSVSKGRMGGTPPKPSKTIQAIKKVLKCPINIKNNMYNEN
ncbi:hypothetical protein GQX74_011607 [Glossina fuscipes]|nr:hypothetical protein GQX74_011607 [Glossina fuscipes]